MVSSSTKEALLCSAFLNPDGSTVLVAMNQGDEDIVVELKFNEFVQAAGRSVKITVPKKAVITCMFG